MRPFHALAYNLGNFLRTLATSIWADAALHIDLDAAVVEEAGETSPARQRTADCLGEFGLLTDPSGLGSSIIRRLLSWRIAARALSVPSRH